MSCQGPFGGGYDIAVLLLIRGKKYNYNDRYLFYFQGLFRVLVNPSPSFLRICALKDLLGIIILRLYY